MVADDGRLPAGESDEELPDRRRFLKGMVAGAVIGAAGGAGAAAWIIRGRSDASNHAAQTIRYAGARVLLGSPTHLGLPIVPIWVDEAGFVQVVAADLRPFIYCGRREDEDVPPPVGDRSARYLLPSSWLERLSEEEARERFWYHERVGEPIRAADFAGRPPLDGVSFVWRDPGAPQPFVGVLLNLPRADIRSADDEARGALEEATDPRHDLVAFDAACTHFCCLAGWHHDPVAKKLGFWDTIFCTCHNARFDPTEVQVYGFEPRF